MTNELFFKIMAVQKKITLNGYSTIFLAMKKLPKHYAKGTK